MSDHNDNTVMFGSPSPAQAAAAGDDSNARNVLPKGTRMGEFEIIELIGVGGFGIVYLAYDHSLERKIALKEYMPASLAMRGADGMVAVRSARHQETYEAGLRSFVNEARLLAQFDHVALVKVHRFWEAGGTAYMVMPFYEGRTLKQVLAIQPAPFDEAAIRRIIDPVSEALGVIHSAECLHRDIAPDNIMLLGDGRPVLLDFGAARRVISDSDQALTVILKPGYAPVEQYAEMPGVRQGPWTDVYALAAVVYYMATRRVPPPSVARMMQGSENLLQKDAAGRYSESFLVAIDKCLSVRSEDRPQSMDEMRALLGLHGHFVPSGGTVSIPIQNAAPATPNKTSPGPLASRKRLLFTAAATLLLGLGAIGYWAVKRDAISPPAKDQVAGQPAIREQAPPNGFDPIPRPLTLEEAYRAALVDADSGMDVSLQAVSPVVIGEGSLQLSVVSKHSGHLYLLLWDQSKQHVYLLLPNDTDTENTLAAGQTYVVPDPRLKLPWEFQAEAPAGDWRVLAVVSEQPRDFTNTPFDKKEFLLEADATAIDRALNDGGGLVSLLGKPGCKAGETCIDRFGAAVAVVNKIEAPASRTGRVNR